MSDVAKKGRMKMRLRRIRWMQLMLIALFGVLSGIVAAATVSLSWDPVQSSAVRGYVVYDGPSAGNYTSRIDVGNVTTYSVPNLVEGATYHFAVTAYDASHNESGYSNDVS